MLTLLLYISRLVRKEPCSLQREILNRLNKKRPMWDYSNEELVELYDHISVLTKRTQGLGFLRFNQLRTVLKYPVTSLNFLKDRKIPINDLEKFRNSFA